MNLKDNLDRACELVWEAMGECWHKYPDPSTVPKTCCLK
jgi:hypothetical protein